MAHRGRVDDDGGVPAERVVSFVDAAGEEDLAGQKLDRGGEFAITIDVRSPRAGRLGGAIAGGIEPVHLLERARQKDLAVGHPVEMGKAVIGLVDAVLDFGGGPTVETELSWAGASGSAYFGSNDAEQVVEWAKLLASAVASGAKVSVEWTLPMRNADRLIVNLTID